MADVLSTSESQVDPEAGSSSGDQEGLDQDYVIRSPEELKLVQEQLDRARRALASMERRVRPVSEARFNLWAEAPLEMIQKLERLIQEYTTRTAAGSASPGDGTKDSQPTNQPPVPEAERSFDSRIRDLDAGIEAELEAAMGGLSEKEIYGDLTGKDREPAAAAGHGRKKGRVL